MYHLALEGIAVLAFVGVGFGLGTVYGNALEQKAMKDLIAAQDHFKTDAETTLNWIKAHLGLK